MYSNGRNQKKNEFFICVSIKSFVSPCYCQTLVPNDQACARLRMPIIFGSSEISAQIEKQLVDHRLSVSPEDISRK